MEVDVGEARVFLYDKGAETFKKTLSKKGFIEEMGLKELVPPFKEEIERRDWEVICKHMESRRRTLVKELYANLGDKGNMTCNVRGTWVLFGENTLSQLFKLKEGVDCSKFEKLHKNPHFEEIAKELSGGQGEW